MTDPIHDPQAALDELASAHLDGQTSPEEARRVAGDPALLARIEQLRQVRDAVRLPDVPVDELRREAAIAAALAAAGPEAVPVPAPEPATADLVVVRARRSARRRWLPAAGVAAAVALAALLLPRLGDDRGSDATVASNSEAADRRLDDGAATSADRGTGHPRGGREGGRERTEAGASALEGPADAGAADTGGTTDPGADATGGSSGGPSSAAGAVTPPTTAGPFASSKPLPETRLLDLGAFADDDRQRLVAAAQTAADDPEATPAAEPTTDRRAAIDDCVTPMEATAADEGASVLYAAIAEMGEGSEQTTVVGIAVELPDGDRELRIRYLHDCAPWFEAPLDEPAPEDER